MPPATRRLPADSLAFALAAAAGTVAEVLAGRRPDAALAAVPAEARPAAMDLAYSALRDCGRGDFLLARLVERPLKERAVRALLLVALARLEHRPEEAHTIVDQAVAAAATLSGGNLRGLVNGVLRNFGRRRDALLAAADADPVARWRHPAWWIDRIQSEYPAGWESILASGNGRPPMTLRVNRRRADPEAFRQELAAAGMAARPLGGDALLLQRPVPVDRLPGFMQGLVSVQDQGAQRAAGLLGLREGLRVLDACAAPGGKTAHVLETADVELTALEIDAERARRIVENLGRLGLAGKVLVADARHREAWWDGRPFDRILADVPCSASGVVRRHPDIKWLRRETDLAAFSVQQGEILDSLWQVLAPGGTMLYCTCSVFGEENAGTLKAFLARHPDARRLPTGGANEEFQLRPDAEHDGFHYALLGKTA
ncbi:MAG TPA: 16S rRNA (cytosine(967)-C(5))-methyltransferase RsmB [Rhodocyclaceae bacterium]|nr:16S rRNA (cytosine(967)-C(5))-methyltransferase RsmB [Rhodocyclaceae bacterium]